MPFSLGMSFEFAESWSLFCARFQVVQGFKFLYQKIIVGWWFQHTLFGSFWNDGPHWHVVLWQDTISRSIVFSRLDCGRLSGKLGYFDLLDSRMKGCQI